MTACESIRGEWGGICPDCGQPLPANTGPLRSWMATRPLRDGVAWNGGPITHPGLSAAQRERHRAAIPPRLIGSPEQPRHGRGRPERLVVSEVVAAMREHRGNAGPVARDLQVTRQSIRKFIERHRDEFPAEVLFLLDARRRTHA